MHTSKVRQMGPEGEKMVKDAVNSPCIDAGDPKSEYKNELQPNGSRINKGAYGNTPEASKSTAAKGFGAPWASVRENPANDTHCWVVETGVKSLHQNPIVVRGFKQLLAA